MMSLCVRASGVHCRYVPDVSARRLPSSLMSQRATKISERTNRKSNIFRICAPHKAKHTYNITWHIIKTIWHPCGFCSWRATYKFASPKFLTRILQSTIMCMYTDEHGVCEVRIHLVGRCAKQKSCKMKVDGQHIWGGRPGGAIADASDSGRILAIFLQPINIFNLLSTMQIVTYLVCV